MTRTIDELALEAGADPEIVARAREAARDMPMVRALVEAGAVEEEELAEMVARAVGTFVVDLERGEFDQSSVDLVSGELARRHLVVPIAPEPSGDALRVAFADPLDQEAVAAISKRIGMGVQPLVATVGGVLDAIARIYGEAPDRPDTRVISRRELAREEERPESEEMGAEDTRRVEGTLRPEGPTTLPMHRLEDEASLEQRHQALLLALVETGVLTHADYLAAVRRLLGRR